MSGANMHKYTSQETQNIGLGQTGAILVSGSSAVTCKKGVFIAITFLEDSVFHSSAGLVAESEQSYLSDSGQGTDITTSNAVTIDGETFPKGITIYGRWTSFKLQSGLVVAYRG